MPSKPRKPCSKPGCPELTTERYCEAHRKQAQQQQDRDRGSSKDRGYDSQWVKVRAMYLRQHPLCERCYKADKVVAATLVHHKVSIKAGGSRLNMGNLMSLCIKCHDEIHMEQGDKW